MTKKIADKERGRESRSRSKYQSEAESRFKPVEKNAGPTIVKTLFAGDEMLKLKQHRDNDEVEEVDSKL